MLRALKQSTAATLLLGPFLDETDGKTPETALTLSQSDILLWKQGGTTLAQKNESTTCTHRSNGLYTCPIDTTDTNTLGILTVSVTESGALPIRQDYQVVPANIWDSYYGADLLDVSLVQVNGSTTEILKFAIAQGLLVSDTVTNAGFTTTATEFEAATIATATSSHWVGRRVYFTSGTLQYQGSRITAYSLVSGRGHFTVDTLTSIPANGVSFIII